MVGRVFPILHILFSTFIWPLLTMALLTMALLTMAFHILFSTFIWRGRPSPNCLPLRGTDLAGEAKDKVARHRVQRPKRQPALQRRIAPTKLSKLRWGRTESVEGRVGMGVGSDGTRWDGVGVIGSGVSDTGYGVLQLWPHRLFEHEGPDLVILWLREQRRSLCAAREAIVDGDNNPFLRPPVEEPHRVPAANVDLLGVEKVLNRARELCEASERREQPAVAQRALCDVCRRDAVSYQRNTSPSCRA